MLNFRSYLNETLEQPYTAYLKKARNNFWVFVFTADDGRTGEVIFEKIPDKDRSTWGMMFTIAGKFDITGRGDAFRIFATVIETVSEFVRSTEVDSLTFTVYGTSRIKLYRRLVNKFATQNGYMSIDDTFRY